MPSNPDSGIHFRDQHLAQHLDTYEGRDNRYSTAKQLLRRYRWLMEQTLEGITMQPAIALALWWELNGCDVRTPEELPILQQAIVSALKEAGHPIAAEGIQRLSLLQWVAVVDACQRVGGRAMPIIPPSSETSA